MNKEENEELFGDFGNMDDLAALKQNQKDLAMWMILMQRWQKI